MGAFYVVVVILAGLHLADMAAIDPELKKSDDPGAIQNRILHWFTEDLPPPPPPPPPFIPPPPLFPPPPPCAPMLYYDEAQDHADTTQDAAEERDYMYPLGPLPPCPPFPLYDDPEVKAGNANLTELTPEPVDPAANTT